MSEPTWVRQDIAIAIHERVLADHGGESGIRDSRLLESALARPKQIHAYGDPDLATLAAAYTAGIIRNHPFLDGNKRVGFMAAYLFLACNGVTLTATEVSAFRAVLDLTAGDMTEEQFSQWLRDNTKPANND
ncbi:MAG: type II toxin-antitoxin system death-on-curing family toxin [Gammaproteobacteria bacterium]|nr:type II toxin-antitoxin system death-on-curing family toxin [Gammaproteobacteria bacterium]